MIRLPRRLGAALAVAALAAGPGSAAAHASNIPHAMHFFWAQAQQSNQQLNGMATQQDQLLKQKQALAGRLVTLDGLRDAGPSHRLSDLVSGLGPCGLFGC